MKYIKRRTNFILARYTTGIKERWYMYESNPCARIIMDDDLGGGNIPILTEFPHFPLDEELEIKLKLFLLPSKKWCRGSFLEQRLSIQRLLTRLLAEGFVDTRFPENVLINDLEALAKVNLVRHCIGSGLFILGVQSYYNSPGRKLIEHFSDWSRDAISSWNARDLYRAIKRQCHRRNVTRSTIVEYLSRNKYIPPNFYRLLFQRFHLKGKSILDPNPGFWSKAIAATLERCRYHVAEQNISLVKFLNTEFFPIGPKCDCVILDNNFTVAMPFDPQQWHDKASSALVFVETGMEGSFPKPYDRTKVIYSRIDDLGWVYYYRI